MGKGSVLLSGFDLINHCGTDPVADKLLSNILHYMATDKKHEPYVAVTDSIVWGDYASERGIVNALCNGLMVNTVPIIPKGQEKDAKYKLKIDEYGYQYAGSYGGRVYNMYPMGEDRWLRSRFREEEARLLKNHL